MSARWCAMALALAACNTVLDLEPGQLVDPVPPSCATGWARRIPIEITSAAGPIAAYTVAVPLAIGARDDLRFALDDRSPPLAYVWEDDTAWVAIPELASGTSRVFAFYDNPTAEPWRGPSPFVADLITNASFETTGAWTISNPDAEFAFSSAWATDGEHSLAVDAFRGKGAPWSTDYVVTQRVQFPAGSEYILRFDLDVVAASNSGADSSGEFFANIGGLTDVWRLSGKDGNITGAHRNIDTAPFGAGDAAVVLGVTLLGGFSSSYAKGFYDHLRVRKHVTPEPTIVVGPDEAACP